MYVTVELSDGTQYEGMDAVSVVTQMRLRDWDIPESNIEFKDNMVRRIQMIGCTIVTGKQHPYPHTEYHR